jgi:hypothetical protein
MIYPSDVSSAASKARKVGVLFLKGGEAAIAEQYAKAWGDAASLRADNPGKDIDQLSRLIANRYLLEVTASGAASGAVAAAPFLGLISTLGSSAADLYLFGRSTARHILTLAALHDLPLEDLQQRRLTVLSSLLSDQDLKDVKSDESEQLIDVLNNKILALNKQINLELLRRSGNSEIALLIQLVFLILPVSISFAIWPSLYGLNQAGF